MKNKTLKRTLITLTLALALLPAMNGQLPLPEPVPGAATTENAAGEETEPGIQPLDDYDSIEKVTE